MMGIARSTLVGALLGLSVLAAAPASAASLDEIMSKGSIVIGVQNDLPPYSLIDENNEPVGYDIEVAQQLAERLGVDLELVVLTPANRVPYLISNRVDAVVATMGSLRSDAKRLASRALILYSRPSWSHRRIIPSPVMTRSAIRSWA